MRLSDSFRTTIADLATDLGAGLLDWTPGSGDGAPAQAAVVLMMAGGSESAALDALSGSATSKVPRYVVGASTDHRLAAAALQRGARDYFALPDDLGLLRRSLERERREGRGRQDAERFAEDERRTNGFDAMVGSSEALVRILDQARRVAPHRDVTVLIGGETGTGKELLARGLHYHSPRAAAPFVEINCAAIPANLLESELFGHEKGAFTGAIAAKPGLFELAHGGTIFLDEVGNLPLELQPKLLRALESKDIRRVGGQSTRKVDVRVIGATHVDLSAAVAAGEFREDLFYRLNVVGLRLPPLRERGRDLELLTETLVKRFATQYGLPVPAITPDVRSRLREHDWPGNIRELRNVLERSLVLSPSGMLALDEISPSRRAAEPPSGSSATLPFPTTLRALTDAAVRQMLELAKGNKSEAARRLGISRPRLQRILDGQPDE